MIRMVRYIVGRAHMLYGEFLLLLAPLAGHMPKWFRESFIRDAEQMAECIERGE